MTVNEAKLQALAGKAIADFGATFLSPLVMIGDRLGLYKALANSKPLTPKELADDTGTSERYVREWLNAHAASGYVDYHAGQGRYSMSPEQAMLFADESSPFFMI